MADDYTPRYVGDTSDPLLCSFTDHSGVAYAITGASNFVLKLKNQITGALITGSGTFQITDGPGGKGTYTFASSDVAVAGSYDLQVALQLNNGTTKHFDLRSLEILAPL